MNNWQAGLAACCTALLLASGNSLWAQDDDLATRATWQIPTAKEIRGKITAWMEKAKLGDAEKTKVQLLWEGAEKLSAAELADRCVLTAAAVNEDARKIAEMCAGSFDPTAAKPPEIPKSLPPVLADSLRLQHGVWLSRSAMYDEALNQLKGLKLEQSVDPATLLFHRSVAMHHLLQKDGCLKQVKKLLENEPRIPRRYSHVAKLMKADIEPLKVDSPDEIARMMRDVRRRLGFGRAGKRVRKKEDDIIAKLDKFIKRLEDQKKQQQQQQQQGQSGGQGQPAQDSTPLQQKGPGKVDEKKVGSGSKWGNLPPEKRRATLQQISRELGAHYREVIEEYFRRLARDSE